MNLKDFSKQLSLRRMQSVSILQAVVSFGGIKLGEKFRELRLSTEVGSSKPAPTAVSPNIYSEAPGICASACAYAFIGEERTLDVDAKLGFHRFYSKEALASSTNKIFSGQNLDDTQKIAAALLLYIVKYGR